MTDRLEGKKVVGLKQSLKVIRNNMDKKIYLAKDCDEKILRQIEDAAEGRTLENIVYIDTMKELGILCGIDVGATIAVLLHE